MRPTKFRSQLFVALAVIGTGLGLPSFTRAQDTPTLDPNSIAVMPFESPISTFRGGPYLNGLSAEQAKGFGDALAQLVTTALVKGGSPVVDRAHLAQIMKEQKMDNSGVVDMATAVQIGKLLGAHYMIFGSVQSFEVRDENMLVVHKTKGEIAAEASLVDVTTGRLVKTFSGKGTKEATGMAANVVRFNGVDQSQTQSSGGSAWMSMPLIGDAAKDLANKISVGLVQQHIKTLEVLAVDPKDGIVVDFGGPCPYSDGDKVVIQRVTKELKNAAGEVVYQQLKVLGTGTISNVQGTAFTLKPDRISEQIAEHDHIVLKSQ